MSSKQLTSFSDFRVEDEVDFLSAKRYVQYLDDYCTHFKLWPYINLSCLVTSLTRDQDGTHALSYTSNGHQYVWECDAVAVCSGLHVEPSVPPIDGAERIPVTLHSSEFKSREQFGIEKTVLIVGSGETSSDVAYLAITAPTKRVVVCHRDGFHLAPKVSRYSSVAKHATQRRPFLPIRRGTRTPSLSSAVRAELRRSPRCPSTSRGPACSTPRTSTRG